LQFLFCLSISGKEIDLDADQSDDDEDAEAKEDAEDSSEGEGDDDEVGLSYLQKSHLEVSREKFIVSMELETLWIVFSSDGFQKWLDGLKIWLNAEGLLSQMDCKNWSNGVCFFSRMGSKRMVKRGRVF